MSEFEADGSDALFMLLLTLAKTMKEELCCALEYFYFLYRVQYIRFLVQIVLLIFFLHDKEQKFVISKKS